MTQIRNALKNQENLCTKCKIKVTEEVDTIFDIVCQVKHRLSHPIASSPYEFVSLSLHHPIS
jgi:hypothetical protein